MPMPVDDGGSHLGEWVANAVIGDAAGCGGGAGNEGDKDDGLQGHKQCNVKVGRGWRVEVEQLAERGAAGEPAAHRPARQPECD